MQNAALRTSTGCTQETNIQICMTKHSHSPYTITYSSTPHNTNRNTTSITSPTQTHNILQHSKAKKNTIFNNSRYTTNIPTDPRTVTTTDIKTNMRHIHTSIVSRHLATRGNNKILCTPPPHISSSEERLPRLTRQLRTNKSPFLKSYLHKVDAKTHPSPLCPLCNIHTHDTAVVTALRDRWTEKQAGGPQVGTSDSSPPTSKGHGSGQTATTTRYMGQDTVSDITQIEGSGSPLYHPGLTLKVVDNWPSILLHSVRTVSSYVGAVSVGAPDVLYVIAIPVCACKCIQDIVSGSMVIGLA